MLLSQFVCGVRISPVVSVHRLTSLRRSFLYRSVNHRVMATKKDLHSTPGVNTVKDIATKDYIFQQTMFRVKNPEVSLDFYTRILGMTLLAKYDFPEMSFTLLFLGYEPIEDVPDMDQERTLMTFRRKACLELTHNWGTESDDNISYHNGNSEPKGFGHIGISVPDVYKACERFKKLGVEFVKEPDGGKMKGLAFIKDPDGYWIEILSPEGMVKICQ